MSPDDALSVVTLFYRHHLRRSSPLVESLGSAGGFSGARFWRITAGPHVWCLRRWPRQAARHEPGLLWIHRQLATAHRGGCHLVPVPLISHTGESLVDYRGFLWQLEPWMPGVASYRQSPSPQKLANAMKALARFHLATRTWPERRERSAGLVTRQQRLAGLFDGRGFTSLFLEIEAACVEGARESGLPDGTICQVGRAICQRFRGVAPWVAEQLTPACQMVVSVQAVIADIWHDHVLFDGDVVTGLVDFGSMRMDTPAADVARLLGSLAENETRDWQRGLFAYREEYPPPGCEENPSEESFLQRVRIFDHCNTAISGLNWLQWILLEGREFGDLRPILERLARISRRLDFLARSV